jgi:hypothetical protein
VADANAESIIMRVIVSEASVTAAVGTADVLKFHKLLNFAFEGRHILYFDTPESLDALLNTFEHKARSFYSDAIKQSARIGANFPSDWATIRIEPTTNMRWEDPIAILPLDKAMDALEERLGILLENAENDWHFLYGIMRQSEREKIRHFLNKGWAEILHGGGHTLRKQLETRLQSYQKGLRTFVLFDSDRLHPDECLRGWTPERPGHRPAACSAFEWEQFVQIQMPFRYWMLRRRFIESYMPQTELSKGASTRTHPDAASAFYRMSEEGRWYFNMKNGFEGDDKRHDKERCRDLYSNVDPSDRAVLLKGFGETLADHYKSSVNNEFNWDNAARQEAACALPRLMRLF